MVDKTEFYSFIESLVGIPIQDATIFFDDLGLAGMDCDILMKDIADKYNIDLSDYDSRRYTMPEVVSFIDALKNTYSIIFFKKRLIANTFTALHLYEVALSKKWMDA